VSVTVAGVPKSETTMKKFPLLVTTSIGLLGVFMTANAFASQVSDHGAGLTATIPDDDSQDATTTGENDHVATESDDSSDDESGDGVDTGEHQGDQGDDEGGDHNSGDHESGDHDGGDHAGGDGGGGDGGGSRGGEGGGDD
jgi:hypothetical protein